MLTLLALACSARIHGAIAETGEWFFDAVACANLALFLGEGENRVWSGRDVGRFGIICAW